MQNVNMIPLNNTIATLKQEIKESPYSMKESRKAQAESNEMMKDILAKKDVVKGVFSVLCTVAEKAHKADRLAKFLETQTLFDLDMLMVVNTRYLITDGELISPSGFHFEDRVFIQPTIAIHCDVIPNQLPMTEKPLRAFDMEKV
jgi:hypothetical protein